MSIAAAPLPMSSQAPRRKRWTVPEFHKLWEEGAFDGRKPMLLDGEILEMPIPGPPHDQGIGLADYALKSIFGTGYWVRIQQPLKLNLWTDPIPDIAVVSGSPRDYCQLPTSALLVVEVADTSLDLDTDRKALLYAAAGILDYWVVDLNHRQLIVFRDPQPDASIPGGFRYRSETRLQPAQGVSPLAMTTVSIMVADLLP